MELQKQFTNFLKTNKIMKVLKKISYELKEYYEYCERYYWFGGILEPTIFWFVIFLIFKNI